MKIYYNIAFGITIISLIIYLFESRKPSRFKEMRWFVLFLLSSFLIDNLCVFLKGKGVQYMYLYNLLTFIEFNLLFYFYKNLSKEKVTRQLIFYQLIIFNVIYVLSTFYYSTDLIKSKFNAVSSSVGAFLIAITLIFYLKEFITSQKLLNYKKDTSFWITVGLLIYYLGSLPVISVVNFMGTLKNYNGIIIIQVTLTILMHFCFILGILWKKRVK